MSANRPLALIILDGYALREETEGNAVAQANTPVFDRAWQTYPHTTLTASGEAVGLPDGQMGNSEVGHLNIGAGRIVYQDLTRINKAIEDRSFFANDVLKQTISAVRNSGKALHICGLLSDGGVHSHITHLYATLEMAKNEGLSDVYVHAFLDGRDVSPDSGVDHVQAILHKMEQIGVGQLASVQGRYYAMDRDKRWDRVEKAYRVMVDGSGPSTADAVQLVRDSYANDVFDEFVEPTVITDGDGEPIGRIRNGDGVIFTNFRPDRAIQLSQALANESFAEFERGQHHPANLHYVCFTQYSETVEGVIAFPPEDLKQTLGQVVSEAGLRQLRIAETEKYPHVTFFFSGGQEAKFAGEERILINSPKVATYDLQPEMSAYEVTEAMVKEIENDAHDVYILNFANPDMVGHSGKIEPTIKAVETVDECLGNVLGALHEKGGTALVTADHGNADQLMDAAGKPHTAHTTNPVPLIVTNPDVRLRDGGILADISPTILDLLHVDQPQEMSGTSLLRK